MDLDPLAPLPRRRIEIRPTALGHSLRSRLWTRDGGMSAVLPRTSH
jgi:hypothetical protein